MLKKGSHITRYYMHEHLSSVFKGINKHDSGSMILSISDSTKLCNLLGFKDPRVTEANFPEYNMLDLPFEDDRFDFVVSEQVLEHVEGDPQQAIDESYRVLKPGGFAVHTTCFINPIHSHPKDFWRFTPDALTLLCKKFSRIVDTGGWGNIPAWFVIGLGLRERPVPHAKWHPMHRIAVKNDPNWPIVTWIVVQK